MASKGVRLDTKQENELREAFTIYDSDGIGKVNKDQCMNVIRSIGIAPTNEQFNKMLGERDRVFTFEEIAHIIKNDAPPFESYDTLLESVRLFDKHGNNYVDAKEFRHVLTSLGEKLKDTDVDELTREMDITSDNQISCDEFVRTIKSVH